MTLIFSQSIIFLVVPVEEMIGIFLCSVKRTKNSFFYLKTFLNPGTLVLITSSEVFLIMVEM